MLEKMFHVFPEVRDFIDNSLKEVCPRKNAPVDRVFFRLFRFITGRYF